MRNRILKASYGAVIIIPEDLAQDCKEFELDKNAILVVYPPDACAVIPKSLADEKLTGMTGQGTLIVYPDPEKPEKRGR